MVGRSLVDLSFESCMHVIWMFFEWIRKDNSYLQSSIPLQLNCRMAPEEDEGRGVGELKVPIREAEEDGVWEEFDDELEMFKSRRKRK